MNSSINDNYPRVRMLGDAALTFEFGAGIDLATHAQVMGFAATLETRRRNGALPGVIEWVPAFASVTVYLDATCDAPEATPEALLEMARDASPVTRAGTGWRIPVCFAPEFAPDLIPLAESCGITPAQVVALMCEAEFRVYMLGFLPGFPYLGGLPKVLDMPRLAVPRKAVPERSVAVAGRMCAVYPWDSPGGWHLLGRTPLRLFDLKDPTCPALFAPGDLVRWQAVEADHFRALDERARRGELAREDFKVVVEGGL